MADIQLRLMDIQHKTIMFMAIKCNMPIVVIQIEPIINNLPLLMADILFRVIHHKTIMFMAINNIMAIVLIQIIIINFHLHMVYLQVRLLVIKLYIIIFMVVAIINSISILFSIMVILQFWALFVVMVMNTILPIV